MKLFSPAKLTWSRGFRGLHLSSSCRHIRQQVSCFIINILFREFLSWVPSGSWSKSKCMWLRGSFVLMFKHWWWCWWWAPVWWWWMVMMVSGRATLLYTGRLSAASSTSWRWGLIESMHYGEVKNSQLWQIISLWILAQILPNLAQSCPNSPKT